MEDCLFCKIVAGEIETEEIHSTEHSYAFRDIEPQAPSHVLVVPRRHVDNADALSKDDGPLLADLFETAREVARREETSPDAGGNGYRLVFNVGDDALNSIPHLHMHVIGGRRMTWPPG